MRTTLRYAVAGSLSIVSNTPHSFASLELLALAHEPVSSRKRGSALLRLFQ
ncbi:MAG: hypothetical protein NT023_06190 [Armatimonadetes bacterium]|nr:hypothetical protein [Armatimonadota bacterium]